MKILFFLSLLMNIVYFLWEFNSGAFDELFASNNADNEVKQILLLSELTQYEVSETLVVADSLSAKIVDINESIVSSGLKALLNNTAEISDTRASNPMSLSHSKEVIALAKNQSNTDIFSVDSAKTEKLKSDEVESINQQSNNLEDLKDEVIPKEDAVVKNKTNEEQASLKTAFCYKIGPFKTRNELDKWSELNNVKVDSISEQNSDSLVDSRFLVYFPAAENFAKSRENALILEKKGITDFWLFRSGELKGAISLGLFIKKNRALSLQQKMADIGVNSEIIRRQRGQPFIYVQVLTKDQNFKQSLFISKKLSVSGCQ